MRRIAKTVLLSGPGFVSAASGPLMGAWTLVDPQAPHRLAAYVGTLDLPRTAWLLTGLGIAYLAALWWAMGAKSRREEIQAGLRSHRSTLAEYHKTIRTAATDDEFRQACQGEEQILQPIFQWIADEMGMDAVRKIEHQQMTAGAWTWPGGPHDVATTRDRSQVLIWLDSKMSAIDEMLVSDAWDGDGLSPWQRLKRWWKP